MSTHVTRGAEEPRQPRWPIVMMGTTAFIIVTLFTFQITAEALADREIRLSAQVGIYSALLALNTAGLAGLTIYAIRRTGSSQRDDLAHATAMIQRTMGTRLAELEEHAKQYATTARVEREQWAAMMTAAAEKRHRVLLEAIAASEARIMEALAAAAERVAEIEERHRAEIAAMAARHQAAMDQILAALKDVAEYKTGYGDGYVDGASSRSFDDSGPKDNRPPLRALDNRAPGRRRS